MKRPKTHPGISVEESNQNSQRDSHPGKEKREKRPAPRPPSEADSDKKGINGEPAPPPVIKQAPVTYPNGKDSRSSSLSSACGVTRSVSSSPSSEKKDFPIAKDVQIVGLNEDEITSHKRLEEIPAVDNRCSGETCFEEINTKQKEDTSLQAKFKSELVASDDAENPVLPISASSVTDLTDAAVSVDATKPFESKSKRTSEDSTTVVPITSDPSDNQKTVTAVSVNTDDQSITRSDASTPTIVRVNANSPFEILDERQLRQDPGASPTADQVTSSGYELTRVFRCALLLIFELILLGCRCCQQHEQNVVELKRS